MSGCRLLDAPGPAIGPLSPGVSDAAEIAAAADAANAASAAAAADIAAAAGTAETADAANAAGAADIAAAADAANAASAAAAADAANAASAAAAAGAADAANAAGERFFGCMALRPVGTAPLGRAHLYRSRQLVGMSADEARFMVGELGIRAVYDLRGEREVAAAPEPVLVGAKTVAYAPAQARAKSADKRLVAGVIGEYGRPGERMMRNYRRYVEQFPLMGTAIRAIANEGTCALVHCVNGKDRTGVLCATLERMAGVHESDIMANYLAANEANAQLIQQDAERLGVGMTARERAVLMSFLEARPEYLQAFFDEVAERFGSFDAYVAEHLHVSPAERSSIARLVTGM